MTNFVFLNAMDDPGLSPQAAKRMRAHITRTNFAKRRERLAKSVVDKKRPRLDRRSVVDGPAVAATREEDEAALARQAISRSDPLPAGISLPKQARDPYLYAQIRKIHKPRLHFQTSSKTDSAQSPELGLMSLWVTSHIPKARGEVAWIDFLASEPALVESSMAIALGHWSPDTASQREAGLHWSRAVNTIIDRISAGRADTAAVMAAVVTMAFGERLAGDWAAWEVHIDGFARLLEQRLARGYVTLPPWICEVLILDAFNNVFNYPRFYHEKVITQVNRHGHHPLQDIVALCSELARLRVSIQKPGLRPSLETLNDCDELLRRVHRLQIHDNSSIRATSLAIELTLRMALRRYRPEPNLTRLAGDMRDALELFIVRPCLYMDITSFHLQIGALAADRGTPEREWYIARLRRGRQRARGTVVGNPLRILEQVLVSDGDLTASLRVLWREICAPSQHTTRWRDI